jgi:hypothetical protein
MTPDCESGIAAFVAPESATTSASVDSTAL